MRKTYRRKKYTQEREAPRYRVNEQIIAPEVKVITEEGEQLGVMTIEDALARAQETGMDLVEVSPKVEPPICRLIDYGKFQYEQEKQKRKAKAKQHQTEVKGIRLSLRIGKHDTDVRLAQAKRFMTEGDDVKVEIVLRGRENQHVPLAKQVINDFITGLLQEQKVELASTPMITQQGNRLSAILNKKR